MTSDARTGHPRLAHLDLEGPAGTLEALLQERHAHDHRLAALVCHPHPLYGGTMHNKVAHRLASTLHGLGAAVLRFNFRGVGRSAGAYDRGAGEVEDARAALGFLRARYPAARVWLAGFSFGAWVAARLAAEVRDVEQLVLVAPPVGTFSFAPLRTLGVPKLVIQGAADDTCPPHLLHAQVVGWAEPRTLVEIPGATHFFDRRLGALGQALEDHLGAVAREPS